jgi:polyhydroxyalkanoate synthase
MSATTATRAPTAFDRDLPPILGANPFVGLSRRQVAAALARLGQRVAVEPGAAAAAAIDAAGELLRVVLGRSDVAPAKDDRRFTAAAWRQDPAFRRLMQAYLVQNHAAHRMIVAGRTDHIIPWDGAYIAPPSCSAATASSC